MDILKVFSVETDAAYRRLAQDLNAIGRSTSNRPQLPIDDSTVQDLVRRAAGRCGAAVGAAVKRAKRKEIVSVMHAAKTEGLDVTPSVAQNTAKRLLGRGLDAREIARIFATPGRTAEHKTEVTPADLVEYDDQVAASLNELQTALDKIKGAASAAWTLSEIRESILADWSAQRSQR